MSEENRRVKEGKYTSGYEQLDVLFNGFSKSGAATAENMQTQNKDA